jgi:hypothetical protein
MKEDESKLGFKKGLVAKSLRKNLYGDLTDHEVECITVILICHLMIEVRINKLLYRWMSGPIPNMGKEDTEKEEQFNNDVREQVYKNVEGINFGRKINLIRPLAKALWDEDGKEIIDEISEINELRNKIFHKLKIKELTFKGKLISTEEGIEELFQVAQHKLIHIDDLIELIESKNLQNPRL